MTTIRDSVEDPPKVFVLSQVHEQRNSIMTRIELQFCCAMMASANTKKPKNL